MSIANESSQNTGPTSDDGTTLGRFRLLPTPRAQEKCQMQRDQGTKGRERPTLTWFGKNDGEFSSSAGVFHASQYLLPANVRLNVIAVGSGRSSRESFAYYDQATSLWKTSLASLFKDLETFSETWPKWGLMRSGQCYRRVPLVRAINGSGFSLLPTPQAMDGQRGAESRDTKKARGSGGINLAQAERMLPTPTASIGKRGYSGQAEKSLLYHSHAGGPINPEWIEHLQGFPIGWSAIED